MIGGRSSRSTRRKNQKAAAGVEANVAVAEEGNVNIPAKKVQKEQNN